MRKKIKVILALLPCSILSFYVFDKDFLFARSEKQNINFINHILNFRYENMDDQNNVVQLTSAKAVKRNNGKFDLEDIQFLFKEGEKNTFNVLSQYGEYDQENQILELSKGVSLLYNNGIQMLCQDVHVNVGVKYLYSHKPVELKAKNFLVSSGEFEVRPDHKVLFLKSPQIIIKK